MSGVLGSRGGGGRTCRVGLRRGRGGGGRGGRGGPRPVRGGQCDGGAGEGVRAAVRRLAGLDRARAGAAQHLVEEGQQAQCGQFGEGFAGRGARWAGAEGRGVGLVDVGDAVVGAVDQGDEGRDPVEHLAGRQILDGGSGGRAAGGRLGAGRRYRALSPPVRGERVLGPRGGAALRSGEPGAPAREVHRILASWCCRRSAGSGSGRGRGRAGGCSSVPHGAVEGLWPEASGRARPASRSSLADRSDIRQTPAPPRRSS